MPNFLGSKGWIGFKPQAVAGTAETTVNTFFPTESFSLNKNPKHIERKSHITTGRRLPMRQGWYSPDGKMTTEVHASLPHLPYWALGSNSTTNPTSGVCLHTITQGDPVNLTCEGYRVFDSAKQADVRLSKLGLNANVGEVATWDAEFLGVTHTDGATLTSTPTFTTDVLTTRAATVSISGSQDVTVQDVSVSIDLGMEQLPTLEAVSGAPHVVRRKEPETITGKLSFIDFPAAELTKLVNATSFALVVYLEGDVISGSYKKFLRLTLPACQYTGGLDPEIGEGVITGAADFSAFWDTATSNLIKVECQNALTTITS